MRKGKVGVGGLLLMILFVILSLSAFGMLSLMTVERDVHLVDQTEKRIVRYYEMDFRAKHRLAQIDEVLRTVDKMQIKAGIEGLEGVRAKWLSEEEWQMTYQIQGEEWERLDVVVLAKWDEAYQCFVYTVEAWIFKIGGEAYDREKSQDF